MFWTVCTNMYNIKNKRSLNKICVVAHFMDLISNEKTFLFIEYILSSLRLAFCILNNAETPSTYENVLVGYKGIKNNLLLQFLPKRF